MRLCLIIGFLLSATRVFADVSVVASVDRNRIGFGESVTLTVAVQGAHGGDRLLRVTLTKLAEDCRGQLGVLPLQAFDERGGVLQAGSQTAEADFQVVERP